jgi:hypothetical protein
LTRNRFRYCNDRLLDLHKIARQLKAGGIDQHTTETLLIAFDQVFCVPPLSDPQVEKVVREIFAPAH